jgi:hypothetical protein
MRVVCGEGLRRVRRYDIPAAMLADPSVSPSAKTIWMVLADLAWACDQVFPGTEEVGKRCGVTGRTVTNQIPELVSAGWLEADPRNGTSTVYIVHVPDRYLVQENGKPFRNPGNIFPPPRETSSRPPRENLSPESLHKKSLQVDPIGTTGKNGRAVSPRKASRKESPKTRYSPSEATAAFIERVQVQCGAKYKISPQDRGYFAALDLLDDESDLTRYFQDAIAHLVVHDLPVTFRAAVGAANEVRRYRATIANDPTYTRRV